MRALGDAEFGDTIYLVADEGENLSAISQRRLVQNLITDGIRTFVFLVNTSDSKTPEEREGPQNMEELCWPNGRQPSPPNSNSDIARSEALYPCLSVRPGTLHN